MARRGWARHVLIAWLVLSGLSLLAYVRAATLPPAGQRFVGFFYFVDDHYNYLSYVEQAMRGHFRLDNKVLLQPSAPALVNLEWWGVGRLAALLGGRPLVAYRVFGLLATLALLAAAAEWLERLGSRERGRTAALLLVGAGGGLGGALVALGLRPLPASLDLTTGLFPFVGVLGNPHFTAGTALLLWSLALLSGPWSPGTRLGGLALGSVLALVRPYDFVLLVAIRGVGVLLTEPRSRWIRELGLLVAFLPAAAYNYWLFYRNPTFSFYGRTPYAFPPRLDLALALAPAALLAIAGAWRAARFRPPCPARTHLLVWALFGMGVILVHPVHFSLQFLVGLGAPLLLLGSLALDDASSGARPAATALFSASALASFALCMGPNPRWFVPANTWETVAALERTCGPDEVLLAPGAIGLYATGLSACRAVVSHGIAPDQAPRVAEVARFYSLLAPPERAALLDRLCVSRLVLPEGAGTVPSGWIGAQTSFRLTASIGSRPTEPRLALYARPRPDGCTPTSLAP